MKISLLLLLTLSYSKAEPKMHTTGILITPGSAFMNYLHPGENEVITKCGMKYKIGTDIVQIDLKMNGTQVFGSDNFQRKLSNLGRNTCGFRCINYLDGDPQPINITATFVSEDNLSQTYDSWFNILIYEHVGMKDTVQYVTLGQTAVVQCGQDNVQLNSNLYNPQGQLVVFQSRKIKHEIKWVTMRDIGFWKCLPTIKQTMNPLEETQELKVSGGSAKFSAWYRTEGEYGLIGCKYESDDEKLKVEYCQFLNPNQKQYTITTDVGATERYTTLGTNIDKLTCQIEFKLPIMASEMGVWKCAIGDMTGGFINTNPYAVLPFNKHRQILTSIRASVDIMCDVPYTSDNCIVVSPLGVSYYGGDINKFRMGQCQVKIGSVNESHIGTWKCLFSNPSQSEVDVIEVEVKLLTTITSLYVDVEVNEYQTADLMCVLEAAITSCQFVDPSGKSYFLSPSRKDQNIQYLGRGFNFGECGIKIKKITKDMEGVWTCSVGIEHEQSPTIDTKTTSRITVNASGVSTASAIGIPIGIVCVVILLVGVGLYRKHRKRSSSSTSEVEARTSTGSNDSNTQVPIMSRLTTHNPTYTNN